MNEEPKKGAGSYRKEEHQHLSDQEYAKVKKEEIRKKQYHMPKLVKWMVAAPFVFVILFGALAIPYFFIRDMPEETEVLRKKSKDSSSKTKTESSTRR